VTRKCGNLSFCTECVDWSLFADTKGWIKTSAAALDKGSGKFVQRDLAEGIGLPKVGHVIFKDYATQLEYIRSCKELWEKGMYVELSAYQCHAFMDFRFVGDKEWQIIHDQLNGAGVPSMQDEWRKLFTSVVEPVSVEKPPKNKRVIKPKAAKKATAKAKAVKKPMVKKAPAKAKTSTKTEAVKKESAAKKLTRSTTKKPVVSKKTVSAVKKVPATKTGTKRTAVKKKSTSQVKSK